MGFCKNVLSNRFISKYMARQHNELFNIEDCFNHLWYMSDPVLRKQAAENVSEEKEEETTNENDEEKSQDDIIFESLLASNENEE